MTDYDGMFDLLPDKTFAKINQLRLTYQKKFAARPMLVCRRLADYFFSDSLSY
jgi:hypothetical protein